MLESNLHRVVRVCNNAKRVEIGGRATSVVGGVVAIIGLALIPVTVGGSLALTVVGGAVALVGGVGSSVVEKLPYHSKLRKVHRCMNVDRQLCEIMVTIHQQLKQLSNFNNQTSASGENNTAPCLIHNSSRLTQSVAEVISLIVFPWDIFELTTNTIKYHNQSEREARRWLSNELNKLRIMKQNAEWEFNSCQQTHQ